MPSNSKNLYCKAYPSKWPYVLSVNWEEASTSILNNNSTISISGSLVNNNGVRWSGSATSYLKLYWYDNYLGKSELVATSSGFTSSPKNLPIALSGTYNATHKPDGSLNGYAWIEFVAGTTTNSYMPPSDNVKTSSVDLTTLPRASKIKSITGELLGSPITVEIERALSTFTHEVQYRFGNGSWIVAEKNVGETCTFTPSLSLASEIPDSTSGTLQVSILTRNGSQSVGDWVYKSTTLKVPSSVVPVISSLTATRIDNGVPSSWGVYVQGYSKCKIDCSAKGAYGSTITDCYISGGGLNINGSSGTTEVLTDAGMIEFTCTVTDSRGRVTTKKISINVIAYTKPSSSLQAVRCLSTGVESSSGTYLKVIVDWNIASVNEKNSVISRKVTCNSVSNTTYSDNTAFILAANCNPKNSYLITSEITDGLGNKDSKTLTIPTDLIPFMIRDDELGAAFGMYSTKQNFLQVAWNLEAKQIYDSGKRVYSPANIPVSVKDAGDGRALTFNYSKNGQTNPNYYACWNGNQLSYIEKKNILSSIGAAASSHSHDYLYNVQVGNGWTVWRFSNGLMIAHTSKRANLATMDKFGGGYFGYFPSPNDYPIPFVEIYDSFVTVDDNNIISAAIYKPSSSLITPNSIYVYSFVSFSNYNLGVYFMTIGRWK